MWVNLAMPDSHVCGLVLTGREVHMWVNLEMHDSHVCGLVLTGGDVCMSILLNIGQACVWFNLS